MIEMTTRQVLLLTICCTGMALCASGQTPPAYELYSWQESNGRWSFCVLRSPSGVNISVDQVFDRRCLLSGVTELKRKLSRISARTTIFWLDGIVGEDHKTKKSARLRLPPPEMIQDIRHYAEGHKIIVDMPTHESTQR